MAASAPGSELRAHAALGGGDEKRRHVPGAWLHVTSPSEAIASCFHDRCVAGRCSGVAVILVVPGLVLCDRRAIAVDGDRHATSVSSAYCASVTHPAP